MPRRTRKKKYIFPGWLDETKIKIILNNWDKKKKKNCQDSFFFPENFLQIQTEIEKNDLQDNDTRKNIFNH